MKEVKFKIFIPVEIAQIVAYICTGIKVNNPLTYDRKTF